MAKLTVPANTLNDMAGAVQNAANGGQPVNGDIAKPSQDNVDMRVYWGQVADLVGGLATMKAAGEKHMPRFPDEDTTNYNFRLSLAKLTNIHNDIVSSLADKPFAEETEIVEDEGKTVPDLFKTLSDDMDGEGNSLTQFAKSVFLNGIRNALDWVFVDYPKTEPGRVYTLAEGKALNIRPFFSRIDAINILEVRSKYMNGKREINYIRIFEPGTPNKVRVFELIENEGARVVIWTLYAKQESGHDVWLIEDNGNLSIDVIPLVPFITGEREGKSWCFNPALRDMVELQICLYRQESALEHIKTVAAFPMLSGNGVKPPMEADGKTPKKMRVGPHTVLFAPPDGQGNSGSWSYVEPSAQTLVFLSADVDKTKQDLREIGKQPLSAQSGNITVITAGMAAGKSKSTVKAWGHALENALENAFIIAGKYAALPESDYSPEVKVYDDYDNIAEGDVDALNSARASKDISRTTYLNELKRRSILSAEFDEEADAGELLTETPSEDMTGTQDPTNPAPQPGKSKVAKTPSR